MQVTDRENIKSFVRQVLGCQCPEDAFRHVENKCSIPLHNGILLRNRINIGNRLLVYVVVTDSAAFVKDALHELLRTGKDERDRMGFNRFRLVLAADDVEGIAEVADTTFNAFPQRDEKVHLHVVTKDAISLL